MVDVVEYDSDDERKYEKEAVPDPTQDDYYHDAVDDFHAQKIHKAGNCYKTELTIILMWACLINSSILLISQQ